MTYRARLSQAAESDLGRAVQWYMDHAPEHASRLIDEFEAVVARICEFPHAAPILRPDARRAIMTRFPYQIWYYCHDAAQFNEIVAVVHHRQQRGSFLGRLE